MNVLKIKKVGIDTYHENIAYMPVNSDLCKSQGFAALSKIQIQSDEKNILATLNMTENGLVNPGEIGLSHAAFRRLGLPEGTLVRIVHPNPLHSVEFIRQKLEGSSFSKTELLTIVQDILAHRYSNIELTAFVIACAQQKLNLTEIIFLTEAMIESGERIDWELPVVLDKHCIGGLPGNRTTMIVVPILAALGLPIPKTSSRAITSPAGTADTMEIFANVNLSLNQMKEIVRKEGACIAWGGSLALAPVDDIIISVERPLNLDSEGQMLASILSKKKAAGSTHVLIDLPVGPTAKVKTAADAKRLQKLFEKIGAHLGMNVEAVCTDGTQPIGRGIGPRLEARDILQVLKNEEGCPEDLKEKSIFLAGKLLELAGHSKLKTGAELARKTLESGAAYQKFCKIVGLQGEKTLPGQAPYHQEIKSLKSGTVYEIQNVKIAKAAKLAGAPQDPSAGIDLFVKTGKRVLEGEVLFKVFAETLEELQFAVEYIETNPDMIKIS